MKQPQFSLSAPSSPIDFPYYIVTLDRKPSESNYLKNAFANAGIKLALEGRTLVSMTFPIVTTKSDSGLHTDWYFVGVSTNLTKPVCAFVVCANGYRK